MLQAEVRAKTRFALALAALLALSPSASAYQLGPAYSHAPYYEVSGQRVFFDRIIITLNLNISAAFGRTQKGMIETVLHDFFLQLGPSPRTHVKDEWFKTPIPDSTTLVIFWSEFPPDEPYRWVAVRRLGTEFLCLRSAPVEDTESESYCSGSWKAGDNTVSLKIDRVRESNEFLLYRFGIR